MFTFRKAALCLLRYCCCFIFIFLVKIDSSAQADWVVGKVCTGLQGPSAFQFGTFGSGNSISGGPIPAVTGYNYDPNNLSPGDYAVVNSTSVINTNQPHFCNVVDNDPKEANGYFLFIDATIQPGVWQELYKEPVTNLCPNTTYNFTADIINMYIPTPAASYPRLRFMINNQVMYTMEDSLALSCVWQTKGFSFRTGAVMDPSYQLSIWLEGGPNPGNDLGIDNILIKPCLPTIFSDAPTTFCEEDPVTFVTHIVNGEESDMYFLWQKKTGSTWTNVPGGNARKFVLKPSKISDEGTYRVLASYDTDVEGSLCRVGDTMEIKHQCFTPQFCTAKLNAPILLKTFGSGSADYSTATPASFGFSTTYKQKFEKTVEDSNFAFIHDPTNDRVGNWAPGRNHTPNDPDGYMLLVNCDFNVGEFYRDTIAGLCEGTSYEFSAWAANIVREGIPSNILFEIRDINDNLRASYQTGDMPMAEDVIAWKKYGLTFEATNDKVILLMKSVKRGGGGNDLVIDDIALSPCIPHLSIAEVNGFCTGDHVRLTGSLTGSFSNPQYQWQKRNGNAWVDVATPSAQTIELVINPAIVSDSGDYRLLVAQTGNLSNASCVAMDTVTLSYACSKEQLCSGSLGEKIIFKDFGAGTPRYSTGTPQTFGFSNTYTQVGAGKQTNDGMFSFQNRTFDEFGGGIWHAGALDHTPGDVGGYMLLVNASIVKGEFYRDTVDGLCIGNTYEFAVHLANMFRPNTPKFSTRPNVKFEIRSALNGSLLASSNSGNIEPTDAFEWKKYGVSFSTPSQSIILLMINDNPGGYGNDLAIDDITFRACNPVTTSANPIVAVCERDSATVQVRVRGNVDYRFYQWQTSVDKGTTWTNFGSSATQSTNLMDYTVTLPRPKVPISDDSLRFRLVVGTNLVSVSDQNSKCRVYSDTSMIKVHPVPDLVAKTIPPMCDKDTFDLTEATLYTGSSMFGANFSFYNSAVDALKGLHPLTSLEAKTIQKAGRYYIRIATPTTPTCTDTASVLVVVQQTPQLKINPPSAVCAPQTQDLTLPTVTVGSNLFGGSLTYFASKADAKANTNAISGASVSAVTLSDTIYLRAATTSPVCVSIDSVIATIYPKPVLKVKNPDTVCTPKTIDLTDTTWFTGSEKEGGTFQFFHTQADAASNSHPISTTEAKAIATSGSYFVRLTTATIPACYDLQGIQAIIHKSPSLQITSPAPICVPDNAVDITLPSITNGSQLQGGAITYYSSREDAFSGNNPLAPSTLTALQANDTLFVRVATQTTPACTDVDSVVVRVNQTPQLKVADPTPVCFPNTVDISAPTLFTGSTLYNSPILFYPTATDATNGSNALSTTSAQQVSSTHTYLAKVTHTGTIACSDTASVTAIIHPLPVASFTGLASDYCLNIPASVPLKGIPLGGIFSGNGITGNNFAPTTIGSYYISYKMTDTNLCSDSVALPVTVHALPKASYTGLAPFYCSFDSSITLNGTPLGGVFTGTPTIAIVGNKVSIKTAGDFKIRYTYSDTFGCKDSVEQPVKIQQTTFTNLSMPDTLVCEGASFTRKSPVAASQYYWAPVGIASPVFTYTPSQTDTYTFTATAPGQCSSYKSIFKVSFVPTPPLPLAGPIHHCLEEAPLELVPSWGTRFMWTDGSTDATFPVRDYGTYGVIAYTSEGCSNANTVEVITNCPPSFFVPNAFSPNGDGENDYMGIYGKNFKNLTLTIFNRWGEVIYVTKDRHQPWDGTFRGSLMEVGVYNWKASYESTWENDPHGPYKQQGSITLIK